MNAIDKAPEDCIALVTKVLRVLRRRRMMLQNVLEERLGHTFPTGVLSDMMSQFFSFQNF